MNSVSPDIWGESIALSPLVRESKTILDSEFHVVDPRIQSLVALLGILGGRGGMPPGSPNPDPISDKKNVIFHTSFQTWPLRRNYVIIT